MKRIKQKSENLFEFCPGNGTRYKLYAACVDPILRGDCDLIVAWLRYNDIGGPSCTMARDGHMDLEYFMEKMNLRNVPDAVAILCFMREQFDVDIHIPSEYENKRWVSDGNLEPVQL